MTTPKTPAPDPRKQQARRHFLRSLLLTAGVTAVALLGYVPVLGSWAKRLRPPGALAEPDFLAACIKCGQCVQVCPVEAIKLADMGDGFGIGTPYIDARAQACDFSCDGLQCVLACPTGALTHEINYPHQATMAVAALVRPDTCLAMQGKGFKGKARGADFPGKLRFDAIDRWNPLPLAEQEFDVDICDLCVRLCPIQIRAEQCAAGKPPANDPNQCPPKPAIKLAHLEHGEDGKVRMRPEILSGCVGCGVCEMVCPAEPAAIIMANADTRGKAA